MSKTMRVTGSLLAMSLLALGQPMPANAAPLRCMKPERVKFAPANLKYRDAAKIQRLLPDGMTETEIKADLVRMNQTYFHADAKLPEFLKNIMASKGTENDGLYETYLSTQSAGDIGPSTLHYTTKPFTDRTAIAEANTWLWTTNSPYYNFYDVSYVAAPAADGIATMKCNDGGIALIGWYRHPTFGTGKVPVDLTPTLRALQTDPSTLAADRVYIASILDLRQEHLPYLKQVKREALEYAAKWGASTDAGDQIDTYYHWPVGVDTVTLHMHVKVNSLWSPVERIKSYRMDDLIEYLEPNKPAWAANTKYAKEAIVKAGNRYYRAIAVTADEKSSGAMPTATADSVIDGNVTWHYIGDRLDVIDYVAHRIWREGGIYMRGNDGKVALLPAPNYKASTAYKIGDQVTSSNNTYRVKAITSDARTGANSAPTATDPSIDIADGNVTWSYLGPKRKWVASELSNPYQTAGSRIKAIVESTDKSSYVIQSVGSKPENDEDPPVITVVSKNDPIALEKVLGRKMTNPSEDHITVFRPEDVEQIVTATQGTPNAATGSTKLIDFLHCQFDLPPNLPMDPDCYKAMR